MVRVAVLLGGVGRVVGALQEVVQIVELDPCLPQAVDLVQQLGLVVPVGPHTVDVAELVERCQRFVANLVDVINLSLVFRLFKLKSNLFDVLL